ncbi:MAG TPA: response regulator, partial [bacterium]|nr:response regulator [bacterium]
MNVALSQTPTVLIVDDSEDMILLLTEVLEDAEYRVVTARNGHEALDMVVQANPDLILLDAIMPNMNGYEVTQILKTQDKTRLIPIIMLTGLSDLNDKLKGIELG